MNRALQRYEDRQLCRAAVLVRPFLLPPIAGGTTIALPYSFSPNTVILSAQVNSNFSTIFNDYNGSITDVNVSAISEAKITFSGTGHDHSGTTKGALVAHPAVNGRLAFVSATSIKFSPFQGNRIYIKTSGVWTARAIASAGVSAANTGVYVGGVAGQNLANSTTYYVYLFDNAGTMTVDFSTTGHATDTTTGMETKSGDDTRLLIGMVRTSAIGQFADSDSLMGVLSYFNRRAKRTGQFFSAARSTTSTTYTELNTEIRANFLTWDDEVVIAKFSGSLANSGANTTSSVFGVDSTSVQSTTNGIATTNGTVTVPSAFSGAMALSEGFHFITILGSVAAGTGTWSGGAPAADSTRVLYSALAVTVRG